MIKLQRLHKYYNRNSSNEIHVINDISLELPDRGLVVLLGPSGSGKTTLLNVLGGLDKVQSGSIAFGNDKIEHYKSSTWDKIRNKQVGYIFQNYNLLNHLTVYENISITLNMIGIYDKEEIDRRIDYILDHMGMLNYRKRKASQLSGGQQQRVAIARALAKNPKVIIADEPTGNLDSKNTQDIMNIIKAISLNKLVVLVTHEDNIAEFYGDRIIRLEDGKIVSDESNHSSGTLDTRHEADIYLGDLNKFTDVVDPNTSIKVYSDEEKPSPVHVRLIVKNNTLYVDVDSKEVKKVQLVDRDSEVKIYDKKYEHTSKETLDIKEFDLANIIQVAEGETKHSVISIKDSLRIAWNRMRDTTRLGRVFFFGFGLIAALIALAIDIGNSFVSIDDSAFLRDSANLIYVERGTETYNQFTVYASDPSIAYIRLFGDVRVTAELPFLFQSWDRERTITYQAEDATLISQSDLMSGRLPEELFEFVMDREIAYGMISNYTYQLLGITTYDKLYELDYYVTINDVDYPMTLVGISDLTSPLIYMDLNLAQSVYYDFGVYELFEDDVIINGGTTYTTSYQALVSDDSGAIIGDTLSYMEQDFEIVGTYAASDTVPTVLIRRTEAESLYFLYTYTNPSARVEIIANDKEDAMTFLEDQGFEPTSYYDTQYTSYRNNRIAQSTGTITFISVVLIASAVSYFFVIRSSLLARIYEVSVYRALGVSKFDIHKMFITETVLITTLTSIIGFSLSTALLYRLQQLIEDFTDVINVTPLSVIVGLLVIYTINIVSGLIPVGNLLRKTPAEILSKYDF